MTAQTNQVNGNRKCDDYTDGPQFGESEGRLASDKTPELTDNKQSGQHQDPDVSSCSKREKSSHQKQESRKRQPGSLPTEDKNRSANEVESVLLRFLLKELKPPSSFCASSKRDNAASSIYQQLFFREVINPVF